MQRFMIIVLLLFLGACSRNTDRYFPDSFWLRGEFVTLGSEGCYWGCPIYQLYLFPNDTMILKTGYGTKKKGIREIEIPEGTFLSVVKMLKKQNFEKFYDVYDGRNSAPAPIGKRVYQCSYSISDSSEHVIQVQSSHLVKKVWFYNGCWDESDKGKWYPDIETLNQIYNLIKNHVPDGIIE